MSKDGILHMDEIMQPLVVATKMYVKTITSPEVSLGPQFRTKNKKGTYLYERYACSTFFSLF